MKLLTAALALTNQIVSFLSKPLLGKPGITFKGLDIPEEAKIDVSALLKQPNSSQIELLNMAALSTMMEVGKLGEITQENVLQYLTLNNLSLHYLVQKTSVELLDLRERVKILESRVVKN